MNDDIRFLLNLQMVADEMKGHFPQMEWYPGTGEAILEGVCFFQKGKAIRPYCAYIAKGESLEGEALPKEACSLSPYRKFSKSLG